VSAGNPETMYARSGDVSIAYQVIGDGPFDVVYVPGAVSHVELSREVPNLRRMLEGLAQFSRLIVFDKRGTGMSDQAGAGSPLETRMDDVRAVMDAAGSGRAAIIGVSEGAPMAALFAATYPERTGALVLYGGEPRTLWAPDYPWGTTEEAYLQSLVDDRTQISQPGYFEDLARSGSPNATDEEIAALVKYLRYGASPGAREALGRMNMGIDVREALPTIRVPVLVLHFANDPWVPVEAGRLFAERIPGAAYVELEGSCHIPSIPEAGLVVDRIERFLRGTWESDGWPDAEDDRVLATILFTDIVDSTSQLAELGDARWRALLEAHHTVVRRQLQRHRGVEVDTAGDGFFASFDGPARAIRCACAITRVVDDLGVHVRAGLHTGECQLVDGKIGGIAVHIGARVAAHAAAREVLVSGTVRDLVTGSGIEFSDRGVHSLKGIPGEWPLYAVALE